MAKNLLIYTRSDGRFAKEAKILAKIQVENSLHFWKPEDILIFTNFPFSHMGVKSHIVPDLSYKEDRTNKIPAIIYLIKNNLLPDELIWYHDFDAYQDAPFDVELKNHVGFTGYGYKDQWNCGSFFFTLKALPLFEFWNSKIYPRKRADEKTLTDLTNSGQIKDYDVVDISYNYGQRMPDFPKIKVEKPIKVYHFHPYYTYYLSPINNFDKFIKGNIVSERLAKLFYKYGT